MHVDGRELPMLSPPAMQEGLYVASAILADVRADRAPGPFRYRDKGMMPAIGRNAAAQGLKTISTTIARISTSEP